ncbi:hypothetical protein COHA_007734 [Chlorella ohadii]|uniref:ADP-ribosylation factor-like protein 2 n=1 Tax=Chlorella ohadii TaxID=2649997 RepID=A0AAD5DLN6_9CHLO|nr:hypothetical protein COHA_007734 [Chlorella ohadii]
MGLLSIIRKTKLKEHEMRLLLVGLDNAGKTTIVKRISGEDASTVSPTLGFNIETLEFAGYQLNVWDVGGQRSLRPYWRNYFEATDGLVWVVDSTDRRRLADCAEELARLLQEERLAGATLLIMANKQDVPGALGADAIREALRLDDLVGRQWSIVACSAVDGSGLLEGFDWLVKDIAARIYLLE